MKQTKLFVKDWLRLRKRHGTLTALAFFPILVWFLVAAKMRWI